MTGAFLQLGLWTAACLAMEALFSGAELALVCCDKLKLAHRAARGTRGARIALGFAKRPEWFFSTTLLGQNLFIVGNSILATFFIFNHFGMEYEFLGLFLAPLILIFGEAVPKAVFQRAADHLVTRVAPLVLVFSYLFYPIIWGLSKLTLLLLGGVKGTLLAGHQVTAESLELLVQDSETPRELSPEFKKTVLRILSFAKQKVREAMTPLADVFSLRQDVTVEEALRFVSREGYSYIPVYRKRAHNIVGVVSAFDLLTSRQLKNPLGKLQSTPLYVPESMGLKDLYLTLREGGKNFAVVVNEFGTAAGVVTLEDLWEEIVGEIRDEYDTEEKSWSQETASRYLFRGRSSIDEINETFRWSLPKENYETLAGFLLNGFGRFPKPGEMFRYGQLTFLIKTATPRSIDTVLVEIEEKT